MKKNPLFLLAAVSALVFTLAVPTQEAKAYGLAGCGLGSLVIKQNNWLQIFAATTNGTFANQTFGIITGTSGCGGGVLGFMEQKQETFVAVNFDNLEQQMAAGQGETLNAFAEVLGCSSEGFGKMTKENYGKFFNSSATPSSLLKMVKAEIKTNKGVSCKAVI